MATFLVNNSEGFPYGLDWNHPEEAVPDSALVQADNCEYDYGSGALRTVSGIRAKLDAGQTIESLFYDNKHDVWYFTTADKMIHRTKDLETYTDLGLLLGSRKPAYAVFGDVCLIASGGPLQAIQTGSVLITVAGSPDRCDFVTARTGRVVTFRTDSDLLSYSAIGDYQGWTTNSNDTSSAQYINVGYKDPGPIVAMDFLAQAVMVYKAGGRAYRIVGEPQDSSFAVLAVSQTAYVSSQYAVVNVGSKSYYLGSAGFMSFVPTQVYGDVAPFEEGLSINSLLLRNMDANARLWHVPNRKQIWLKAQSDGRVYLYHYSPRFSDGRGVFTVRTLAHDLSDVCAQANNVYIAYGNKIGVLDDSLDTDDGQQIVTRIKGRNKVASRHSILVMNNLFVCKNRIPGYGSLKCGKKTKTLYFNADPTYAYDATGYAYDATGLAYVETTYAFGSAQKAYYATMLAYYATGGVGGSEYTRKYKVGGGSNTSVQGEITVYKGAISLVDFHYEYLEV